MSEHDAKQSTLEERIAMWRERADTAERLISSLGYIKVADGWKPPAPTALDADALEALLREIGRWSVVVSQTGVLAPDAGLLAALEALKVERAALIAAAREREELRSELERERMRLAACGVAAIGCFDGCAEEYKSASLDDVLALRTQLVEARAKLAAAERVVSFAAHTSFCAYYTGAYLPALCDCGYAEAIAAYDALKAVG